MLKKVLGSRFLTLILFFTYIFILTWVILAKLDWSRLLASNISWINNPRVLLHPGVTWVNINVVPYAHFDKIEVFLNILFFIPFGIFLKVFSKKFGFFFTTFLALVLSLFYEGIQYVLNIGFADITDLIDNTLGAVIGWFIVSILSFILEDRLRIYANIILCIFTAFIVYEIHTILF